MEEANRFMELWKKLSWRTAVAISLLVICSVPVLLDIWSQKQYFGVNEELTLGSAILLVMVAIGVVVLILCGMQMAKYDYMEKSVFVWSMGERNNGEEKGRICAGFSRQCGGGCDVLHFGSGSDHSVRKPWGDGAVWVHQSKESKKNKN